MPVKETIETNIQQPENVHIRPVISALFFFIPITPQEYIRKAPNARTP